MEDLKNVTENFMSRSQNQLFFSTYIASLLSICPFRGRNIKDSSATRSAESDLWLQQRSRDRQNTRKEQMYPTLPGGFTQTPCCVDSFDPFRSFGLLIFARSAVSILFGLKWLLRSPLASTYWTWVNCSSDCFSKNLAMFPSDCLMVWFCAGFVFVAHLDLWRLLVFAPFN